MRQLIIITATIRNSFATCEANTAIVMRNDDKRDVSGRSRYLKSASPSRRSQASHSQAERCGGSPRTRAACRPA